MKGLIIIGVILKTISMLAGCAIICYFAYYLFTNPEMIGSWIHRLVSTIK